MFGAIEEFYGTDDIAFPPRRSNGLVRGQRLAEGEAFASIDDAVVSNVSDADLEMLALDQVAQDTSGLNDEADDVRLIVDEQGNLV